MVVNERSHQRNNKTCERVILHTPRRTARPHQPPPPSPPPLPSPPLSYSLTPSPSPPLTTKSTCMHSRGGVSPVFSIVAAPAPPSPRSSRHCRDARVFGPTDYDYAKYQDDTPPRPPPVPPTHPPITQPTCMHSRGGVSPVFAITGKTSLNHSKDP